MYAIVSASSEGIGNRAMAGDFGRRLEVNVFVDVSAAIDIARRKGLGRIRRLDTHALWVQDAVRQLRVTLVKARGTQHLPGMMTKY